MFKPILFLSAAIFFSSLTASTAGISPQLSGPGAMTPSQAGAAQQDHAKQIYARECSMCHGDNGNGQTDMAKDLSLTLKDFTDPKALAGKPDQELFALIRKGRGKMLPESDDRISDNDVKGLILYIRGFSKDQPAAPLTPGR